MTDGAAQLSHFVGDATEQLKHSEGIPLGTHPCPLCGNDTPKGQRYCRDCDEAGSYATSASSSGKRSEPRARRGANTPLVLLFFVLSAFGTVMAGIFVPSVLTLPLFGEVLPISQAVDWGEIRTARVTSHIRAQASTTSQIVGKLAVGDSVRVEGVPNGWFKVYDARPASRMSAEPLGFVYGTLLVPVNVQLARSSESGGT